MSTVCHRRRRRHRSKSNSPSPKLRPEINPINLQFAHYCDSGLGFVASGLARTRVSQITSRGEGLISLGEPAAPLEPPLESWGFDLGRPKNKNNAQNKQTEKNLPRQVTKDTSDEPVE